MGELENVLPRGSQRLFQGRIYPVFRNYLCKKSERYLIDMRG